MKRLIFLIIVASLLLSSIAYSQLPENGYIGLFNDNSHSGWCVRGEFYPYPVEMWIYCLPSYLGQICAEFMICYPSNVIQSTVTWNDPIISVMLGDLQSGLSVCYNDCQWSWHWIAHQLLSITDPTQTMVYVCAHPEVGTYHFANCEPSYLMEPCISITKFYINYPYYSYECGRVPPAIDKASWGAIKSIMSE